MTTGFAASAFPLLLRRVTSSPIRRQRLCYVVLFLVLAAFISGCGSDKPSRPREPSWEYLGFYNHLAVELELDWPYLYACAAGQGLFRKSLSRGATRWEYIGLADTTIADAPFGPYIGVGVQDVLVLDNGDILAAVYPGRRDVPSLYRSTDDGASWVRSDMMPDSTHLPVWGMDKLEKSPCGPGTIFATCGLSIFRSEDNGSTWDTMWGVGGGGPGLVDLQVHPSGCDQAWGGGMTPRFLALAVRSIDHGETWQLVEISELKGDNTIFRVVLNPGDPNTVYFSILGSILKTVDGGNTWERIWLPLPRRDTPVEAMVIDENNPEHFFIGAWYELFESWDGCESVESIPFPDNLARRIMDMEYDSGRRTLYVGTHRGVLLYQLP